MPDSRKRRTVETGEADERLGEPDKRKAILRAAVQVFAAKGYQGCRIADVAQRAEVAYGLVYHYFKNKDDLLESVFDQQWRLFIQMLRSIQAGPGSASEQLAQACGATLDAVWRDPSAARVLLLEMTRHQKGLREEKEWSVEAAIEVISEIVQQGQRTGELRPEADPLVIATALLGALEVCLTSMLMGVLVRPDPTEEEIARVKRNLIEFLVAGVAVSPAQRAASAS